MSRRALSPQQFFHGSTHEFNPGDTLEPGREARHGADNDRVWVSDNAWQASAYGAHTYEVTPHAPPKKRGKMGEFYTSGATVVDKVPNQTILDHANALYIKKR